MAIYMLPGLAGIKHDGIDLFFGKKLPRSAHIRALEQPHGGAGINQAVGLRIFANDVRTALAECQSHHLAPLIATVAAGVDAAAGAGEDVVRVGGVNVDGEDVGIIGHAGVNRIPGFAAVGRFPGQVGGAGVHDVGIFRIDRGGSDAAHFQVLRVGNARPASAGIFAHPNAAQACPR